MKKIIYTLGIILIGTTAKAQWSDNGNTLTTSDDVVITGHVNVGGEGNYHLKVRHIDGKHYQNSSIHQLYLNYNTSQPVLVGYGGQNSDLYVSGEIGIGTTSPLTNLDINGNIGLGERLTGGTRYIGKYVNGAFGGNSNWIGFNSPANEDFITFGTHKSGTGGGERMRIDALGNIGIGTTTPGEKLQIGNAFTFHDGGHEVLGFGCKGSGSTDLDPNGYASEIRLDPTTGNFRFAVSSNLTDYPQTRMTIKNNGFIGIGTLDPKSKLSVDGQIRATEVKVLADISVPDYVFEPDYELRTLKETKEYITKNKHLPEIPSASEIGENGIDIGDMNMRLLKKIEELTLYQIQLMEEMEAMKKELQELKK
ncbi:MAG: hypothetical protein RLN90_09880 [Balneolaceae bacterium]